ncbi:hypothetical protein AAGS61_17675 [Lysinibacillus sp. KU-BSD001]|uniref:hypothetical protein n=1 Tax=Lysinibacillus sp. KU-BSD001 TaxID=3141328 RepID=UPI0036E1D861
MQKVKFSSKDAIERRNSVPSTVVIAPTGTGKSTLCNTVINSKFASVLSIGVGEKSQTTKLSTQFILDSRIDNENEFSLLLEKKSVDLKVIQQEIITNVCKIFLENGFSSDDSIESFDEEVLEKIISPENALYDLSQIKNALNTEELVKALGPILKHIEESFSELVSERRKNIDSKNISLKEIRRFVFEDLWDSASEEDKKPLLHWLKEVEMNIESELVSLTKSKANENQEILITNRILNDEQKIFLTKLYDSTSVYSLVVKDVKFACKPHSELIEVHNDEYPFRFAIRDTMGITQGGIDPEDINSALEVAFNFDSDSIFMLISLEERDDVIQTSLEAVHAKLADLKKRKGTEKPIYILFTKADKLIEAKIDGRKDSLTVSQSDYDQHILNVINEVEETIAKWRAKFKTMEANTHWLSLRYRELEIDPTQKALKDQEQWLNRFKPKGLYNFVNKIAKECQLKLLPMGQEHPLLVTPKNYYKDIINVVLSPEEVLPNIQFIRELLIKYPNNVDEYYNKIVNNEYRYHGRAVSTYWRKLSQGEGHKTRSRVYANFNLNMSGLIRKVIESNQLKTTLINALKIDTSNLTEEELKKVTVFFNKQELVSNQSSDDLRNYLEVLIKNYLDEKVFLYYSILITVAYRLSYENPDIRHILEKAYCKYISYDQSLREVQKAFYEIFKEDAFLEILVQEWRTAVNHVINKSFVVI